MTCWVDVIEEDRGTWAWPPCCTICRSGIPRSGITGGAGLVVNGRRVDGGSASSNASTSKSYSHGGAGLEITVRAQAVSYGGKNASLMRFTLECHATTTWLTRRAAAVLACIHKSDYYDIAFDQSASF